MKDVFRLEIEMDQKMCGSCKKSSSEYYELETQLRFIYFDDLLSIKEKAFDIMEGHFNSINKIDEIENGFNIYFRSHSEMNKMLRLFNRKFLLEEKRSKKLIGNDTLKSKMVYRYFQNITLINIKKGDKISIKGENYFIKAINNNRDLVILHEITGAKKVVSYPIIKDYFRLLEKSNA